MGNCQMKSKLLQISRPRLPANPMPRSNPFLERELKAHRTLDKIKTYLRNTHWQVGIFKADGVPKSIELQLREIDSAGLPFHSYTAAYDKVVAIGRTAANKRIAFFRSRETQEYYEIFKNEQRILQKFG